MQIIWFFFSCLAKTDCHITSGKIDAQLMDFFCRLNAIGNLNDIKFQFEVDCLTLIGSLSLVVVQGWEHNQLVEESHAP